MSDPSGPGATPPQPAGEPAAAPAAAGGNGNPPAGGAPPPASGGGPRRRSAGTPDNIDRVIFLRDLDEVHLLIDFISGRADKNLSDLRLPNPGFDPSATPPDPNAVATLAPTEAVRRISLLRYPPAPELGIRADDAALLLLAKDQLTALASPARGLSIAYTAMFVGATRWFRGSHAPDSLIELAQDAFPALHPHVRKFSKIYFGLILFSFIWLFLTALTYWDVAMGRSILQGIDQLHKDQATIVQANAAFAAACTQPNAATGDPNCARLETLAEKERGANVSLVDFVACKPQCSRFIHVMRWGFVLCGFDPDAIKPDDKYLGESMAFVLTVFSTYILPMMFGLLGTAIAAIRAIQSKVRDSELSPRDLILTVMGLPIGLVAGVAVGLFYSPSAAPGSTGSSNLAGDLTLTASGLGFLAGYGSESFFKSLDALLTRVFQTRPPPAPSPSPPAPG